MKTNGLLVFLRWVATLVTVFAPMTANAAELGKLPASKEECEALRDIKTQWNDPFESRGPNAGACFGLIHRRNEYFEACLPYPIDFARPCNNPGRNPATPLFHAVEGLNENAVRTLLTRGADARREHLLHQLRFCDERSSYEVCQRIASMLIKHGADIEDTQKFDGGASEETPLIFHSRARAISVVKVLLDAGANVNAAGQGGCTALDQADQNNDTAMIALIESHGGKRGCSVMRHLLGPILRKIYEGPH